MAVQGARVTVGTAPTLLSGTPGDSVSGSRVTVRNASGTTAVDLGGPAVAAGAGYELAAGGVASFALDAGEGLYAVVGLGDAPVHVLRTGV